MEKEQTENEVKNGYVYLVKTPISNDIYICASDSVFYPGTHVVCPTKYGMDMAIIVGSAAELAEDRTYTPGCKRVCGSCHYVSSFKSADDLVAEGDYEDLPSMGETPSFDFIGVKDIPETEEKDEDPQIWDSAYTKPEMVEIEGDIDWISHMASPDEIKRFEENKKLEENAIKVCKEKIIEHKLDMKLVAAHFLLCESKVLFFFTADERVDFRDLVKDLVAIFKMRIELRQIGVRDESRVLGALGVCGRDLCCHCVSSKFDPVTIKMAKEQNISLNSMKISGPCGRLLCCLSYEYDFYTEEKQNYPQEGSKLKIGGELYKVTEINIFKESVTVLGPEDRMLTIPKKELYLTEEGFWKVSKDYQSNFLDN